ncbi:MAG: signal peptidase I [Chloroflexi bacterium]|nr:signal peptidase I [Chloroflexota bacterium]|tara:strand:+ start:5633 stop:6034 length:402 start_codon:yes stop_codon:yes gene_type:complete
MNVFQRIRFQKNLVLEDSMNPNIIDGDEILLKKVFFYYSPSRFDIVKINSNGQSYIKRIIGLPNENLMLNKEKIYINDVELEEKFEFIKTKYSPLKISLGKNEIFLMGDNRANSIDSRALGPFNLNHVVAFNQ